MTTDSTVSLRERIIARLGPLRVMLIGAAVVIMLAAPFADGAVHAHDWRLIPGVVAPSLMMMLVFAFPLDMTMARVFMADAEDAERQRLRFVIRVEALVYLAMLAAWTPFLLNVLELSPFG
ncbi:MAG: hypothetical protein RLW62_20485 [Gammaproteobacteria bacterium]